MSFSDYSSLTGSCTGVRVYGIVEVVKEIHRECVVLSLCPNVKRFLSPRMPVRSLFVFVGVLLSLVATASERVRAQEPPRRLGTNLDSVTDYAPQLPFTDIFLNGREWFTQCRAGIDPGCSSSKAWDTGEAALLDTDADGWVRGLPAPSAAPVYTSVATFWDLPAEFPKGRYIVLYQGRGSIEYSIGATKVAAQSARGRDVIDVDIARGGILLRITETDPQKTGDYIRAIRVVAAQDEERLATNRFSRRFVDQLRPYQALRFMDWMRTNDSELSVWSDRPKPSDARFSTSKGVPVEVMVELSNVTDKAPWFTIPHRANDEFVRNFATVVKDTLRSNLPVYLEYSNEIWNGGFSQGAWVEAQGEAEWPTSPESPFTKRMNWYGKRSAEVCEIWRSVFADSSGRIVCVIASQAANSWTAQEALTCPLWSGSPCSGHGITALAIAPYMGDYLGQEENLAEVSAWGSSSRGRQKLFTELDAGGVLGNSPTGGARSQSFGWIEANKQVADRFGIALLAYEGGQHLVGVGQAAQNPVLTTLFTEANRDARMGALYTAYFQGWEARGGGLFMHYSDSGSYSRYGSWGALELVGQQKSPKYDALWSYSFGAPPSFPSPLPTPEVTPTPRNEPPAQEDPPRQVTPTPQVPPVAEEPPTSPAPSRSVTVIKRGRGEIVSSPSGIRCGRRCSATFSRASLVTFRSSPAPGYRFLRWSGGCTHTRRTCQVSLPSSIGVTAIFVRQLMSRANVVSGRDNRLTRSASASPSAGRNQSGEEIAPSPL